MQLGILATRVRIERGSAGRTPNAPERGHLSVNRNKGTIVTSTERHRADRLDRGNATTVRRVVHKRAFAGRARIRRSGNRTNDPRRVVLDHGDLQERTEHGAGTDTEDRRLGWRSELVVDRWRQHHGGILADRRSLRFVFCSRHIRGPVTG